MKRRIKSCVEKDRETTKPRAAQTWHDRPDRAQWHGRAT